MWKPVKSITLALALLGAGFTAAAKGDNPQFTSPENDPASADWVSELPVDGAMAAWRDRIGRLREAPAPDASRDATFCLESQWRDAGPAATPYGRVVNRCTVAVHLAWCSLDGECEATGGSMRVLEPNSAQRVSDTNSPRYRAVACFGPIWPGGAKGLAQGYFCAQSDAPRGQLGAARPSQLGDLANRCESARIAAGEAVFGPSVNAFLLNQIDDRIHKEGWLREDIGVVKDAWVQRALAADEEAPSATDAYTECLLRERIREVEPDLDFNAVLTSERLERFVAALPRREAGAGASMLRDSLDPAARAAREAQARQARARNEAARRESKARSDAFWNGVMQVGAVVAQSYIDYEYARALASPPSGSGAAMAQTPLPRAMAPAQSPPSTSRTAGLPDRGPAFIGGQSGRRNYLTPDGQPCIRPLGYQRDRYQPAPETTYGGFHFQNVCDTDIVVHARVRGEVRGVRGTLTTVFQRRGSEPGKGSITCLYKRGSNIWDCVALEEWWTQ